MSDNPSGRVAGLFAAMLGVSAAVGLSVYWLGNGRSAEAPAEEAVAAEAVKTEATKPEAPAEEPAKVARAPKKRKLKITWEGGGSDSGPSEQAAAPARPYYTGGAVNQPRPVRIVQPRVEVTRANGKIIVTTYRPGR